MCAYSFVRDVDGVPTKDTHVLLKRDGKFWRHTIHRQSLEWNVRLRTPQEFIQCWYQFWNSDLSPLPFYILEIVSAICAICALWQLSKCVILIAHNWRKGEPQMKHNSIVACLVAALIARHGRSKRRNGSGLGLSSNLYGCGSGWHRNHNSLRCQGSI